MNNEIIYSPIYKDKEARVFVGAVLMYLFVLGVFGGLLWAGLWQANAALAVM